MKKIIIAILIAALLAAAAFFIIKMTADEQSVTQEDALYDTPYVDITISGTSFSPAIELADGSEATVTWYEEETGTVLKGLSPTFIFDSVADRHVRLMASYSDGTNALGDIVTFNVGFDYTQDSGRYNIGSLL